MFERLRKEIEELKSKFSDKRVGEMFEKCFFNTIDTTCKFQEDGSVFVITGDIPAMWLRDSTAQVLQYLYFAEDEDVKTLIKGVIKRQIKYIITDTYANAFMLNENCVSEWDGRYITERSARIIWERKFELDSLCYPLFLASKYYEATGDSSIFDDEFLYGYDYIISTFKIEQKHSTLSSYKHKFWDEPTFVGEGNKKRGDKGLIWSGYRPSDDRCEYNYHIPDNMFVVSVMNKFYKIFNDVLHDEKRAEDCDYFVKTLTPLIEKFGIKKVKGYGKVYVSETDCLGHYTLNDDANIPSLLSIPYLEYPYIDKEIYNNTRKWILSKNNEFYYEGSVLKGIGSPHTPNGRVWPLSLCMQGITSEDSEEIMSVFNMLINSDEGTGYMHESVDVDNPAKYSRPWFAWANSMFAYFVLLKKEILIK